MVRANRTGRDRIQLLLRNARQMKKIVEATYPSLDFGDEVRDIEKECSSLKVRRVNLEGQQHTNYSQSDGQSLACKWQGVVSIMSTIASIHPKLRIDQLYFVTIPSPPLQRLLIP
jgi:ethanolaminephosphotransferase